MTRFDSTREPDDSDAEVDPTDDALDEGVRRALRDLLRDEPVDVDPERRDTAVLAALAAAADLGRSGNSAPPQRAARDGVRRDRWRSPMPALVAAALVVLVAAGAFALTGNGFSSDGGDELATTAEAGITSDDASPEDDGPDRVSGAAGGVDQFDADRRTAGGRAPDEGAAQDDGALSTTIPSVAARDAVIDLGEFPDPAALLDVATAAASTRRSATGEGAIEEGATGEDAAAAPPPVDAASCEPLLLARNWTPLAVATIQGSTVLVADGADGSTIVVRADDCSEIARR
jgi:hypothetical protein